MDARTNPLLGRNPANDPAHRQGADVDSNDQLSSVMLLGLAIAGGVVAIFLEWLTH
ncbi:hypothetical protein [Methylobacterium durans]|uniref:hypothetical protein n=1 Tax=Methylobacterium durans TaxID=2202825 RepID=UPI0013A5365B|nr:hypothetical protein [Methylobacterium durans]